MRKHVIIFKMILSLLICVAVVGVLVVSDTYRDTSDVCTCSAELFFKGEKFSFKNSPCFVDGRMYLPLGDFCAEMGADVSMEDDGYIIKYGDFSCLLTEGDVCTKPLYINEDEVPYIYLYDAAQFFSLSVVFEPTKNGVSLYPRTLPQQANEKQVEESNKAYIRLEDIRANWHDNKAFNDYMEKLRTIADYMYSEGEIFHIAWIPKYVNPQENYENDLITDFNLYNADFLYTLDYMVAHGGKIVLHGFTHQYGDDISGVGYEFGDNCPFTLSQCDDRMKEAKRIAEQLQFDSSVFEVPHYVINKKQLKLAEDNFDVIYQKNMSDTGVEEVYEVKRLFKTIKYVPTPIGYLPDADELSDIITKINETPQGQLVSLFVHPFVDFESISFSVAEDGSRLVNYNENGVFPQLLKAIREKDLVFSAVTD